MSAKEMVSHQVKSRFQICSRSQEHIKSLISKYLQEKKTTSDEYSRGAGVRRCRPLNTSLAAAAGNS